MLAFRHHPHDLLRADLDHLADELISLATGRGVGIREGVVMTVGAPPYRRIDCDGRALAYVRSRPRRRAVRVDVSGLWLVTHPPRSGIRGAGGGLTLLLQGREDVIEATRYLEDTVRATRAAYDRGRLPVAV